MEPNKRIKQIFQRCKNNGININLDSSCYRSTSFLKPSPSICIGNNDIETIIEELQIEGSSKIQWNFYGNIENLIKDSFESFGFVINTTIDDYTQDIQGSINLIIDDKDFIVPEIDYNSSNSESGPNNIGISELINIDDLTETQSEYSTSSNEEIIIEVKDYKDYNDIELCEVDINQQVSNKPILEFLDIKTKIYEEELDGDTKSLNELEDNEDSSSSDELEELEDSSDDELEDDIKDLDELEDDIKDLDELEESSDDELEDDIKDLDELEDDEESKELEDDEESKELEDDIKDLDELEDDDSDDTKGKDSESIDDTICPEGCMCVNCLEEINDN